MKKRLYRLPFVMFFTRDINKLEHNANSQYRFNRFWATLWFIVMIALPFSGRLYDHNVSALIITEVSLWANFATHFGAMSAALAAMNTSQTVEDIADDVDDIHDVIPGRETFNEETADQMA